MIVNSWPFNGNKVFNRFWNCSSRIGSTERVSKSKLLCALVTISSEHHTASSLIVTKSFSYSRITSSTFIIIVIFCFVNLHYCLLTLDFPFLRRPCQNKMIIRYNKRQLHYRSLCMLLLAMTVDSWSPSATRRQILHKSILIFATTTTSSVANAACLQGDLRPECIGVYKVPLDDNVLPYVGTKEALKKFAPDLEFVAPIQQPKSPEIALEILQTQRLAADDIKAVVSAGRIEEAGIKTLNLIPKVTSSGRYLLSVLESRMGENQGGGTAVVEDLKITMLQNQLNMVVGLWGDCDVVIGQGLRGEMGVSAVAQITILNSLREASSALDDFLVTVSTLLENTKQTGRR